jgi:LTXXQ motif family protein
MAGTSWHHIWFVLALAAAATGCSAAAEARHWRYHWHYHHGFQQETAVPGEETARGSVGNSRSRIEVTDFGGGIKRMIGACAGQAIELKTMPFDLVSRTVQPNEAQRKALDQVRSTTNEAAATLSASCPRDIPAELGRQLDRLADALDSISASLAALRPALANLYDALDDEQKAHLVTIEPSHKAQSKTDRSERRMTKGGIPNAERDPVCHEWVVIFRSWPVTQIERAISLSDEQHADLHDLTAAMYRAAGGLARACAGKDRLTALGRLDAKQQQLQAMRQGIDMIKPVLSRFEESLNDTQRTRLAIAIAG